MALLSLGAIPPTILLLSTFPVLLISALVYRAFFSHLSSIPGPWPCRFTSLWIWYHSYLGHEASLITSLHAQYGPIVRIGPSSVVISDGAALNAIYNERGGFRKADCYANFDFEGHATIFSSRDGEYRALRSKAVTPLFSTSRIRAGQKTIEECVRRFIERVRVEAQEGKPVDILNPCRSLAIDAVSSYLFGRPYGGIEEKSDRLSASVWVDMVVDSGRFFFLPHWLFVAIEKISSKVMPCVVNAAAEAGGANLETFARAIVEETPAGDETYQGRLKAIGVSDDENQIQCMDLMFAGKYKTRMNIPFRILAEVIRRHRLHWNYVKQVDVAIGKVARDVRKISFDDPSHNMCPQLTTTSPATSVSAKKSSKQMPKIRHYLTILKTSNTSTPSSAKVSAWACQHRRAFLASCPKKAGRMQATIFPEAPR